jgi:hypothetical protein
MARPPAQAATYSGCPGTVIQRRCAQVVGRECLQL